MADRLSKFVQTGHESVASVATATALTPPAGQAPSGAIISVGIAGSVRWWADGTSPTASTGILVPAGGTIEFMTPDATWREVLAAFKAIATGTDTTLEVAYFTS